ncbi:RNA polymerase-binding protein DksA [Pseudomarimonas arenosa]|uniref:RNA polymerase-binding transcription factor DksA n=1 Tax=Pseudomarimonas arenosa TaxID=2774145 RepID=A0AAW3ZHV5_9GAMM|nr:RNA polymerase-binding protein DksA [Pseudomarimonas arenosa]
MAAKSKTASKKTVAKKPATKPKATKAVAKTSKSAKSSKSSSSTADKGPVKKIANALAKLVKPAAKTAPAKTATKATSKTSAKVAASKKPAAKKAAGSTRENAKATTAKPSASKQTAKTSKASTAKAVSATSKTVSAKDTDANARKAMPVVSSNARSVARAGDSGVKAKAVKPSKPSSVNEVPQVAAPVRVELPDGYRPSSGDSDYMGPMHLEYFRQKLLNWRNELVEESKQTIDNLREEVRDVGDEAERATRETENSLELRTRDRYRKLIAKIDKALKRIDDGSYGFCEETGEEIGIERLEARPIATLCLDAQERWEHRQKLMGD